MSSGAFLSGDIKKLLNNGNEMLAAGDFFCAVEMLIGNNLMSYRESAQDTMITPLLVTDSAINCMAFLYSNTLCIGGAFVGSQNDSLNHIASIDITTGLKKQLLNSSELKVYPNPSSDFVTVEAESNLGTINLFDVTGKLVYQSFENGNKSQFPIKELSKGIYFLKSGKHIEKIIKQ